MHRRQLHIRQEKGNQHMPDHCDKAIFWEIYTPKVPVI